MKNWRFYDAGNLHTARRNIREKLVHPAFYSFKGYGGARKRGQ
jgi:hypothetical protein